MQNVGKIFESSLLKSAPDYALMYRLKDPASSFGSNNSLRFSPKNPFDYIIWDSKRRILYAIEAKTVAGNSISFEREKEDKGTIHFHQIEGLNYWSKYDGTVCGFVIEFREHEKTIFLRIEDFLKLTESISKKSFSILDLEKNDIKYTIIPQQKKRTRYTYDIDSFLSMQPTI